MNETFKKFLIIVWTSMDDLLADYLITIIILCRASACAFWIIKHLFETWKILALRIRNTDKPESYCSFFQTEGEINVQMLHHLH